MTNLSAGHTVDLLRVENTDMKMDEIAAYRVSEVQTLSNKSMANILYFYSTANKYIILQKLSLYPILSISEILT